MARFIDKQKALVLRKEGKSYSQIKNILNINKSTLSGWLKKFPLSEERIRELRDNNEQRIEHYRQTRQRQKNDRLKKCFNKQKKLILPLSDRELFVAGLFLYWGEGSKCKPAISSVCNTDPAVIRLFVRWFTECWLVPKEKLKVQLHLYNDMDIEKEIKFWLNILGISREQFIKPYIKKTSSQNINHKGSFGHGTCTLQVGDARLTEKIHMSLQVIADCYLK